jgi:hypothetical protein
MECIKKNYTENSSVYVTTIREFCTETSLYSTNEYRQREYHFDDVPGGSGDQWQRDLFATLITGGVLLPIIIETDDETATWGTIEDGQQRCGTIVAINQSCVRLPSDMEKYGVDYTDVSNRTLKELKTIAPHLHERFYNSHIMMIVCRNTPEPKKSTNFIGWNNGNPLSDQEKRSAQYSHGAHYLHDLVKSLKTSTVISTRKDTRRYAYLASDFPITGKILQQIVAFWYDYHLEGKILPMTQSSLERRYKSFLKEGITAPVSTQTKNRSFEKMVSILDNAIYYHSANKPTNAEFFGKRQLRFFFHVLHALQTNNVKIDVKTLAADYERALVILSTENAMWTHPTKKFRGSNTPKQYFWDDLFNKSADEPVQIGYVVHRIVSTMIELHGDKLVQLDSRREFTTKQKRQKYEEQNGQCYYCNNEIDFSEAIGEHSTPHSKGGKTDLENCIITCAKCNTDKGTLAKNEYEMVLSSRGEQVMEFTEDEE